MYLLIQLAVMNKKNMEIISSIGSVVLLMILFGATHQMGDMFPQEYGFIFSLVIFIVVMSVVGLKLNEMN